MRKRQSRTKSEPSGHYLIGFAAALAEVIRIEADAVLIDNVLDATGVSLEDLRKAGVEEYDLGCIVECVGQLGPREGR